MKTTEEYLAQKPLDSFLAHKSGMFVIGIIVLLLFPLLVIVGALYPIIKGK